MTTIRNKIGQRIRQMRKRNGYTIIELEALTGFAAPRISNWERGARSPGPDEIIELAKVLNISPAYLSCFTDDETGGDRFTRLLSLKTIPIFSLIEACNYKKLIKVNKDELMLKYDSVFVEEKTAKQIGKQAFAIKLDDESMQPIFEKSDVIVVDPQKNPTPGQYVLAKTVNSDKAIFRKYREISKDTKGNIHYELTALNHNWPTITGKSKKDCEILGVMVELRRFE